MNKLDNITRRLKEKYNDIQVMFELDKALKQCKSEHMKLVGD